MNRGKQVLKKGIWHIGSKRKTKRKKQKGGAFPIGLIASVAGPMLSEIAKPIFKKIIGRGRRKKKMVKQTINLRKRAAPKIVNLPNGRSFTSKWERISRKQLPINIKVNKQRTISPRRNNRMIYLNQAAPAFRKIKKKRKQEQSGKGLASSLAKAGVELGTKAFRSEFGKKLINKGIDSIPNIFKFGVSKIKNKNVRRAMTSDIADMVVDEAQNRAKNKCKSLFDDYKKWEVFQTFK